METDKSLGLELYDPSKTFVKSGARAIAVLEYFYRVRQPTRAIDICHDLELPVSSTKYLLETLVECGYLTFNSHTKTYFPSIILVGFAGWLSSAYANSDQLMALARTVHDRTGADVGITVENNDHMQALISERNSGRRTVRSEFNIPIIGSASGGVALAGKPDIQVLETVRRVCAGESAEARERLCDRVLAKVREFRRLGYAYNFGDVLPKNRGVAIALPKVDINVPMVLGVSGPAEEIAGREEDLVALMRQAVASLL